MIRVRAQVPPSGLNYKDAIPAASEWGDAGLLLTGDDVPIAPIVEEFGLPKGKFSIHPSLPDGMRIDPESGQISGAPLSATARADYVVTLKNSADQIECKISLEVQMHTPPGPIEYGTAPDKTVHAIFPVDTDIHIEPTSVDSGNHLIFSVSPDLPQGLELCPKTSAIKGTVSVAMERTTFTVTAQNKRGQQSSKVVFAVADKWQAAVDPQKWTCDMCSMWLRDELELHDDDIAPFMKVDGQHLMSLDNKEVVKSKHPDVPRHFQISIAFSVINLKQAKKEEEEAQKAAKEAIGGLDALMQSLEIDEQTSFIAARSLYV